MLGGYSLEALTSDSKGIMPGANFGPNEELIGKVSMKTIFGRKKLKKDGSEGKIVHDDVILEGPTESAEVAKAIVVDCKSKPFDGKNILKVGLSVDAKNWYSVK
ncbi:hypothetical protein L1987_08080 [Smallanthus sonchifolius]|uniref:Uncharacterized protein n=1 Tax=Smallanthus sonchifolius TaxID=185202 RepID=A0ACB9JK75_9ASTR|nr:hypothetical protein L1987_08080 [Smallanthus sonchifolius]